MNPLATTVLTWEKRLEARAAEAGAPARRRRRRLLPAALRRGSADEVWEASLALPGPEAWGEQR